MSGIRSGLSTQIIKEEKQAVYTHYYAHALNLAIGETIKCSRVCCDALDAAFEICKLIKFSPKRNALFDKIKVANADELEYSAGIQTLCLTRWTVQGNQLLVFSIIFIISDFGMSAWNKVGARCKRVNHWCKSTDV